MKKQSLKNYSHGFRDWKQIKSQIRFWLYRRLKNGVVFLYDGETLENAHKKVRVGGYIVLLPKKK